MKVLAAFLRTASEFSHERAEFLLATKPPTSLASAATLQLLASRSSKLFPGFALRFQRSLGETPSI